MQYKINEYRGFTRITGIDKNILDLSKTFNCGQCFRWSQIGTEVYLGIIYEVPLLIRQMQFEDGTPGLITTATKIQVKDLLIDYLQLNIDYANQLKELDEFAQKSMEYGIGIRILRQEPWETLVSFIISQRNNIPKISSTIERLCNKLGDRKELKVENQVYSLYTFPTPEVIDKAGIEGLQGLGLGYRDEYILKAAQRVVSGQLNLGALNTDQFSTTEALSNLQELYGVGPKVANCIALFGLGKLDGFPIDIWMERVINRYYPNGIDISRYGKLAGLIQQYMFYYIKNNG